MSHYKVIIQTLTQSEGDHRLTDLSRYPDLADKIADGVFQFDGTTVEPFRIDDIGAGGNGTSIVLSNSNNKYSFSLLGSMKIAARLGESIVLLNYTTGGSAYGIDGPNPTNGIWSTDTANIPGGAADLLTGALDRIQDFQDYCTAGSHTWELLFIIRSHGHANDTVPYTYDTERQALDDALIAKLATFSITDPLFFNVSIPVRSNQFNKKIRSVYFSKRNTSPEDFKVFDMSNGDIVDDSDLNGDITHAGYDISEAAATWMDVTYDSIVNPVIPTPQPANRGIFNAKIGHVSSYDSVGRFFEKIGTLTEGQQTAIRTAEASLKAAGIWNKYPALWIWVGGASGAHQYDLKNPDRPPLGFVDITHDADGVTFNGSTSYIQTSLRITDFPFLKFTGFGLVWYQQNNRLNTDEVICSITQNGSTNGLLRVYPSRTGSSGRMRCDIGTSGFDFVSNAITDTQGVTSFQTNGTHAQFHKRGIIRGQKVFTTVADTNGKLIIGHDSFGGGRFFNGTLSLFGVRQNLNDDEIRDEATIFQQLQIDLGREVVVTEADFPASYQDLLDAATANADTLPTSIIQQYQQEFLEEIEDLLDGVDILRCYAGDDNTDDFSLYNMVRPSNIATISGTVDRDAGGWKGGGGTSDYINNNHDLALDCIHFSQNNASILAFVIEAQTAGAAIAGCASSSFNRLFNSTGAHRICTSNALNASADLSGAGYRAIRREDATNVRLDVDETTLNRTATATGIASETFLNFKSGATPGDMRLAFSVVGRFFNTTESMRWRTAMRNYLIKLGFTL
jgi:hypothetical protein